jgi:type I pantothenate kinase
MVIAPTTLSPIADAPYQRFTREQWQARRGEWPMPLTEADCAQLQGQIEQVSLDEIQDIYVPIARLLQVFQTTESARARTVQGFLGREPVKVPFIIGVSGSVAVGKSMTSRVLQALLSQGPDQLNVIIVPTDGFLKTTLQLAEEDLLDRKGFPESYCVHDLLSFLQKIKSGDLSATAPVYSHQTYDIKPDQRRSVVNADVIIVEGLNLLQTGAPLNVRQPKNFVSDYIDFSIYVDAEKNQLEEWFLQRFLQFKTMGEKDPQSFFYQFKDMTEETASHYARTVWRDINLANLEQNILPFKYRADLILHKSKNHQVDEVLLRYV